MNSLSELNRKKQNPVTCQQNGLLADQSDGTAQGANSGRNLTNIFSPKPQHSKCVVSVSVLDARKIPDKQDCGPALAKPGRGGVRRWGGKRLRKVRSEGKGWVKAEGDCTGRGGEEDWGEESRSRKIMLFAKRGEENEIKRGGEKKEHWWQQPDATSCDHQSQRGPIRSAWFTHSWLEHPEVLPCKWISILKTIKSSIINQTDSSDWWFSRFAHTVLAWLVANRLCLASPSGSYWLFFMPDAMRDGRGGRGAKKKGGHVEGNGEFSIKSSGWESGHKMSQLLFWMLYGMACSCAFSALNIHFGQFGS